MTHPYFVSIKDLIFQRDSKIIINPAENDVFKEFGKSKNLMFPFQSVTLIEELAEEEVDTAPISLAVESR